MLGTPMCLGGKDIALPSIFAYYDQHTGKSLTRVNITCIIHAFNSGQMQGVESRRHNILFQGFRKQMA